MRRRRKVLLQEDQIRGTSYSSQLAFIALRFLLVFLVGPFLSLFVCLFVLFSTYTLSRTQNHNNVIQNSATSSAVVGPVPSYSLGLNAHLRSTGYIYIIFT
jgi:hypothetical protein